MKRLTKTMIENWKNDSTNVIFEKDGFIKIVTKEENDLVCDWINPATMTFASLDIYDDLDKVYTTFVDEFLSKKTAGMSDLEKIEYANRDLTDYDKACIAHFKNRLYF